MQASLSGVISKGRTTNIQKLGSYQSWGSEQRAMALKKILRLALTISSPRLVGPVLG